MLCGHKSSVLHSASAIAVALFSFGLIGWMARQGAAGPKVAAPETMAIAPGSMGYRASGEYLRNDIPVDAPLIDIGFTDPLHIMKYQVSVADYARCVDAGACEPGDTGQATDNRVAVTGMSFEDAQSYASWLSKKTGQVWRLPSDEEWAYAAGSRFYDDALGIGSDGNDPSKRWIAEYRRNTERGVEADPEPKPPGFYGENEHGISDLSGNVWEWTSSCHVRARVTETGAVEKEKTENCGVRVVEGRHRAYMITFVRDAKGGGCSVGTPPDSLGFRLVRDDPRRFSFAALKTWWRAGTQ